jgi:hypothetical protein
MTQQSSKSAQQKTSEIKQVRRTLAVGIFLTLFNDHFSTAEIM